MVNDTTEQSKKELFTQIEALYFQEIKQIKDAEITGEVEH